MKPLTSLGDLAPVRNAAPARTHSYVDEQIRLREWAKDKYGLHEKKDAKGYFVPRIMRRDAITMAKWWKAALDDVNGSWWDAKLRDLTGKHQHHRDVLDGYAAMELAAYSSFDVLDVATGKIKLADVPEELSWSEAEKFWRGMRTMALAMGAAKVVPTLLDHGRMLAQSYGESIVGLPGRIADTAKDALDLAKDVKSGIDSTVTALKWAGIVGGGLLGIYVISHVLPDRPQTAREREETR